MAAFAVRRYDIEMSVFAKSATWSDCDPRRRTPPDVSLSSRMCSLQEIYFPSASFAAVMASPTPVEVPLSELQELSNSARVMYAAASLLIGRALKDAHFIRSGTQMYLPAPASAISVNLSGLVGETLVRRERTRGDPTAGCFGCECPDVVTAEVRQLTLNLPECVFDLPFGL